MDKKVRQLSTGQRRKLEIACLMANKPNVLLLDEPTNYISLDELEALESAILNFPGPVIAVSHDRWFIQRFGGDIWELDDGKLQGQSTHSKHFPMTSFLTSLLEKQACYNFSDTFFVLQILPPVCILLKRMIF